MRRCPGCHGWFPTPLALDAHRRNRYTRQSCRYEPDEPRSAFRPGWLARREILPYGRG